MLKVESCATSPEPCSATSSGMAGASWEGFLQEAETYLCPEERHPLSRGITKLLAKLKCLTDVIRASWGLFRNFWGLS